MTAALRYNPILVFASEGDGCGDSEGWDGLSVLYVSPIRALLNNQEERLQRYFRL